MARYTGPSCKLMRREQMDLELKTLANKSLETKCHFKKLPGQSGMGRRPRPSVYRSLLREKQKLRRIYGVMEKQFRRHYKEAARRSGSTGVNLLQILESRLDNVVYRMGFGCTRAESRQLVNHNAVEVNGMRVNIPSYEVKPGDTVGIREKSRDQDRIKGAIHNSNPPIWVDVDGKNCEGKFLSLPERSDLTYEVNETLVVGFYSK